jgi:hypothetical protein
MMVLGLNRIVVDQAVFVSNEFMSVKARADKVDPLNVAGVSPLTAVPVVGCVVLVVRSTEDPDVPALAFLTQGTPE